MKELSYVIKDELGIHARPAGLLVKEAGKFDCKITIKKGTTQADAKSIFGVMTLGVKKGDEIRVSFDGKEENEAFGTLKAFIENNL